MSGHHDEASRPADSEESLLDERELAEAFRAIRDRYDGEHEEADLTLQRALFQTRVQRRRQRFTRWVVLPAAAVLVASTAWAGVTGRLSPAVRTMLESIYEVSPREGSRPAPPTPAPHPKPAETSSEAATVAAVPDEPPATPVETSEPPPAAPAPTSAPVPSATVAAPAPPRRSEVVVPVPSTPATSASAASPAASPPASPAAAASASDPHASLFAEAHRIHFTERDPARALAAWDRYLDATPSGRFAPEARYNRALALVRLGRTAEAKQELAAFANGIYGEYRRAEAKALLDALARDAGH